MISQSLVSARRFAELAFEPGSAPCERTIRRWVANDLIPGRMIGDRVFINLEAFWRDSETLFDKVVRDVSRSP